MKGIDKISIKGIAAGIFALVILSAVAGFLISPYILEIYKELGFKLELSGFETLELTTIELIKHPHYLPIVSFSLIATTGISSYIAAFVAGKAYVINAIIVGVVALMLGLVSVTSPLKDPLYIVFLSANVGVAYISGRLCKWWVSKNASNCKL